MLAVPPVFLDETILCMRSTLPGYLRLHAGGRVAFLESLYFDRAHVTQNSSVTTNADTRHFQNATRLAGKAAAPTPPLPETPPSAAKQPETSTLSTNARRIGAAFGQRACTSAQNLQWLRLRFQQAIGDFSASATYSANPSHRVSSSTMARSRRRARAARQPRRPAAAAGAAQFEFRRPAAEAGGAAEAPVRPARAEPRRRTRRARGRTAVRARLLQLTAAGPRRVAAAGRGAPPAAPADVSPRRAATSCSASWVSRRRRPRPRCSNRSGRSGARAPSTISKKNIGTRSSATSAEGGGRSGGRHVGRAGAIGRAVEVQICRVYSAEGGARLRRGGGAAGAGAILSVRRRGVCAGARSSVGVGRPRVWRDRRRPLRGAQRSSRCCCRGGRRRCRPWPDGGGTKGAPGVLAAGAGLARNPRLRRSSRRLAHRQGSGGLAHPLAGLTETRRDACDAGDRGPSTPDVTLSMERADEPEEPRCKHTALLSCRWRHDARASRRGSGQRPGGRGPTIEQEQTIRQAPARRRRQRAALPLPSYRQAGGAGALRSMLERTAPSRR